MKFKECNKADAEVALSVANLEGLKKGTLAPYFLEISAISLSSVETI